MTDNILSLFASELKVINIGSQRFADALEVQGVTVQQVDWVPVAGGDTEMQALLDFLGGMGE